MKTKHSLFLFMFFVMGAQLFSQNQFVLKGKIEGKPTGKISISYTVFSNTDNKWTTVYDTVAVKNGDFLFHGSIREPLNAWLSYNGKSTSFYIEPTNMELYLPKNNIEKFKLQGSKTQDDAELLASGTKKSADLVEALFGQLKPIREQLDTLKETHLDYKKLSDKKEYIERQMDSIRNLIAQKEIGFIRSNPNSALPVVSFTIEYLYSRGYLSLDSAKIFFNNLPEKVRLSCLGMETNKFIQIFENVRVGKTAPDFNTPDMNGKMVHLCDFRGKSYVMLDFWASWCGPCLRGVPHLKKAYAKYHEKGFEVVGVSVDRSNDEWLTAIKKHDISNWHHVLSVQSLEKRSQGYTNDEDIDAKYPVSPIPRYVLIDKAGAIIGMWESYSEENEKDQDTKLKEVFGE
ncbi:MAG TPA: TlpA disulfide reductase family protein [Paludibacter sp.]|nr:TlpA disulfide reductase family protein [Paludibacter sp.]